MKQKWIYTLVLLLAGSLCLNAQEYVEKADTVTIHPRPLPLMGAPSFLQTPEFLMAPDPFETPEQRAARINWQTYDRVMTSVNQNLSWYKPPHLTKAQMVLLFIGGLFLNSPYKFQPGTVPLMNASNPFIYARTPGMAPYEHRYSPEAFPQCIRTEFDFTSGTYRQVMVQWNEVEKSMVRSYGGPYRNDPVPKMQFSSDRMMLP